VSDKAAYLLSMTVIALGAMAAGTVVVLFYKGDVTALLMGIGTLATAIITAVKVHQVTNDNKRTNDVIVNKVDTVVKKADSVITQAASDKEADVVAEKVVEKVAAAQMEAKS
jgi:hypothetical protein